MVKKAHKPHTVSYPSNPPQICQYRPKKRSNAANSDDESVGSNDISVVFENERRGSKLDACGSSERKGSCNVTNIDALLIEVLNNFDPYITEKGSEIGQALKEELQHVYQSCGRTRSSSSESSMDVLLIKVLNSLNAYVTEKRSTIRASKEALNDCIAQVQAMEGIPEALSMKAADKFKSASSRTPFLLLQD